MRNSKIAMYAYYLLSSLKPVSFAAWKAEGEPNPFLPRASHRRRRTSQQELLDLFEERGLGWRDPGRRNG